MFFHSSVWGFGEPAMLKLKMIVRANKTRSCVFEQSDKLVFEPPAQAKQCPKTYNSKTASENHCGGSTQTAAELLERGLLGIQM
jgi:hypothetical protein